MNRNGHAEKPAKERLLSLVYEGKDIRKMRESPDLLLLCETKLPVFMGLLGISPKTPNSVTEAGAFLADAVFAGETPQEDGWEGSFDEYGPKGDRHDDPLSNGTRNRRFPPYGENDLFDLRRAAVFDIMELVHRRECAGHDEKSVYPDIRCPSCSGMRLLYAFLSMYLYADAIGSVGYLREHKNELRPFFAPYAGVLMFMAKEREKRMLAGGRNRLGMLLNLTKEIIEYNDKRKNRGSGRYDGRAPFMVVKTLADKINADNALALAETGKPLYSDDVGGEQVLSLMVKKPFLGFEDIVRDTTDGAMSLLREQRIRLGHDPAISLVYNRDSFAGAMSDIGSDAGEPWKEDPKNHHAVLFLEMGLTVFTHGVHSAHCGIAKAEGEITVGALKCNERRICDISPLYKVLRFDGENWCREKNGTPVTPAVCFEFGAIFEIGRLLMEKGISFV
jgi:hypothetical protein